MLAAVAETREAAVNISVLALFSVISLVKLNINFMRRSGSRASKVSTDAQDSLENSFPGIPDAKWHEFLEKEETEFFILGLREEIIQKCLDMCFDSYLEKQTVAFTVHCAYLAMCKVLNVYYMVRDPGDCDESKEKKSWEPDLEPDPSIIDSWGSQCIPVLETEGPKKAEEFEKDVGVATPDLTVCGPESIEICSFISDLFDIGEGEYYSPLFSLSRESSGEKKSSSCLSFGILSVAKTLPPCMSSLNTKKKTKSFKK